MIKESKSSYEAPEAILLELCIERHVCISGGEYPTWEEEDI